MITFHPSPHTKEKGMILTDKGRQESTLMMKSLFQAEEKAIRATLENYSPQFIEALETFSTIFAQAFQETLQQEQDNENKQ